MNFPESKTKLSNWTGPDHTNLENSSKAEKYQQQGYRKSRWPTLDQLRPKLREASLTESALEDNNSSQEGQVAEAGIPKKMTTTSSSTSTPTAGDSYGGTSCLTGDNCCGGTGSSSYKSRMMRGEFRVLLTAWSKSISRRLYDVKCFLHIYTPVSFFFLSLINLSPCFSQCAKLPKSFLNFKTRHYLYVIK